MASRGAAGEARPPGGPRAPTSVPEPAHHSSAASSPRSRAAAVASRAMPRSSVRPDAALRPVPLGAAGAHLARLIGASTTAPRRPGTRRSVGWAKRTGTAPPTPRFAPNTIKSHGCIGHPHLQSLFNYFRTEARSDLHLAGPGQESQAFKQGDKNAALHPSCLWHGATKEC